MKINYLKPVADSEIMAETRIVHRGKQKTVGDAEIRDTSGAIVVKALSTYAIWIPHKLSRVILGQRY